MYESLIIMAWISWDDPETNYRHLHWYNNEDSDRTYTGVRLCTKMY